MANRLTMAEVNAIVTLHQSKHSNWQISKLLGVNRTKLRDSEADNFCCAG